MTAPYPAAHTPGVPADVASILRAGGRVARLVVIPATRMGLRLLRCSDPRGFQETRALAGATNPAHARLSSLARAVHLATGIHLSPRELLLALRLILSPRPRTHGAERRLRLVATLRHLQEALPVSDLAAPLSVNYLGFTAQAETVNYPAPDALEGPRLLAHHGRLGEAAIAVDLLTRQLHAAYVANAPGLFVPMLRLSYPTPGCSLRVPLVRRVDRLGNTTWSARIGEVRPDNRLYLAGMPHSGDVAPDAPIAFTFSLFGVAA